jgi:hypothetical protein
MSRALALALLLAAAPAAAAPPAPVLDAPVALPDLSPTREAGLAVTGLRVSTSDGDGSILPAYLFLVTPSLTWPIPAGPARAALRVTLPVALVRIEDSGYPPDIERGTFLGNPRLAAWASLRRGHLVGGAGVEVTLGLAGDGAVSLARLLPAEIPAAYGDATTLRLHLDGRVEAGPAAAQVLLGIDHALVEDRRDQTLLRLAAAASVRVGPRVAVLVTARAASDLLDEEWDEGYDWTVTLDGALRVLVDRVTVTVGVTAPLAPDARVGAAVDLACAF